MGRPPPPPALPSCLCSLAMPTRPLPPLLSPSHLQYTIPAYIVAYATQAPFFIALSGITYAILSASWDEDVRGRTFFLAVRLCCCASLLFAMLMLMGGRCTPGGSSCRRPVFVFAVLAVSQRDGIRPSHSRSRRPRERWCDYRGTASLWW